MNETYKAVCMWQDETVTVEYVGKWFSQAHDACERAMENGAIISELQTLDGDVVVSSIDVPHPAWS